MGGWTPSTCSGSSMRGWLGADDACFVNGRAQRADERPVRWLWTMLAWVIALATVAGAVYLMHREGRPWWCHCGKHFLWVGDIWSEHCSQHLVDPYVFTHVSHGMIFYGMFTLLMRRSGFAWKL